jgi:hypothetical protein
MNIQINRLQTEIYYPNSSDRKIFFGKTDALYASAPAGRRGGIFKDIETESEMIRSAKLLIEAAKSAQASLNHLLADFGDAAMK